MKILLISFLSLWIFSSCQTKSYPYREGVEDYLSFLGEDLTANRSYLIIPTQNCASCTQEVLDFCKSGNCSAVERIIITQEIEWPKNQSNVLFDRSNSFGQFETGIFEPFLFTIRDSKWVNWRSLKDLDSTDLGDVMNNL